MQTVKYHCDKCKKEVKEDEFASLRIGDARNYEKTKIDLCVPCQEKVGIVEKKGTETKVIESTADKLYDIIADVVYENLGE